VRGALAAVHVDDRQLTAAERAHAAITQGASYRVIPWQMGWVAKLLRALPNPLFDRLLASRPRKRRRSGS